MTWTVPTPDPVTGPLTGDDRPILEAYLAYQRRILLNICAGLTGEQLAARPLASSNLSLLGLVRHWRGWSGPGFASGPEASSWSRCTTPLSARTPTSTTSTRPRQKPRSLDCRANGKLCDEAVAGMAFEDTFDHRGEAYSLRMTYVHMIAEYARHNGHADLLREAIDGTTGR